MNQTHDTTGVTGRKKDVFEKIEDKIAQGLGLQGQSTTGVTGTGGQTNLGQSVPVDNRPYGQQAKDKIAEVTGTGQTDTGWQGERTGQGPFTDNRTFTQQAQDKLGEVTGTGHSGSGYGSNLQQGSGYGTGGTGTQDPRSFTDKAKDAMGLGHNEPNITGPGSTETTGPMQGVGDNRTFLEKAKDTLTGHKTTTSTGPFPGRGTE